jgi:hypothetical protein
MARALHIDGHRYWILSEPRADGWMARVIELCEDGTNDEIGIEASAETRSAADAAAERKLRRLLQLPVN